MAASPVRLVLQGLRSWWRVPPAGTGGTVSARYCYSVYLRHRVLAGRLGFTQVPRSVVELGPGDSLGIGLMALLTGAERYWAIDAVRHASPATNVQVFDGLVELLNQRAPIPTGGGCAEVRPVLADFAFPRALFPDDLLARCLQPERVRALRDQLLGGGEGPQVHYLAPWGALDGIDDGSVDWVFSQAVLEHVDKLPETYQQVARCLRPGGWMTHQIDFRCHDTAREWNGHLRYPDWLWALMRGNRPWFVNRVSCTRHLQLLADAGVMVVLAEREQASSRFGLDQLPSKLRASFTEQDVRTAGATLVAARELA